MTVSSLRKAKGLSQDDLALKVGVKKRTIASYERHERKPSPSVAMKLANELGIGIDEMWTLFYYPDPQGGEPHASAG